MCVYACVLLTHMCTCICACVLVSVHTVIASVDTYVCM